jgi:hypothetical protein
LLKIIGLLGRKLRYYMSQEAGGQHPGARIRRCLALEVVVTGQGPLFKGLLKVLKKVPI